MLYRHLKNVSGHLLKKFAGNLLNCLASKGVAVDHVRAFLSHMNDTTHLDYLESFVPAAILLAGHGPDWQNHHRIGRAVQVPDELMEALCPGLPHLMETYPGKLHLFKHLMVVMIQVITSAAAEPTVGATVCFMHAQCNACMAASQPDRDSVQKAMLDAAESCEAMVPCALNGAVSCSLGRLLCKFAAAAASLLQVHM